MEYFYPATYESGSYRDIKPLDINRAVFHYLHVPGQDERDTLSRNQPKGLLYFSLPREAVEQGALSLCSWSRSVSDFNGNEKKPVSYRLQWGHKHHP